VSIYTNVGSHGRRVYVSSGTELEYSSHEFHEPLQRTRPLGITQSDQERLYLASRMESGDADFLTDFASCTEVVELWDLMELARQLEITVDTIRLANGAST
jgi:hypothetical protein